MKKWFSRLVGAEEGSGNAVDAAAVQASILEKEKQQALIRHEIDAAYYRWLSASGACIASAALEEQILEQVRALAARPEEAAGIVPRVPEVIPRLLRSLRDEDVSTSELAQQASQDVVLMAEIIRDANSAYYRPMSPVKTVEAAIMMLGQNGLRMLLARVGFRPVIKQMGADGFSKRVAPQVWRQSEKCALAASLMAPGLTAGVFESYLAGLMQNVGLVVAFRLAERASDNGKVPASSEFGVSLLACSRQLSAGIARHWDFPSDVADAVAQAGDPGDSNLALALAQGDRIAKIRLLLDACILSEDDTLVSEGLDNFQRRCLGKLSNLED